MSLLLKKVVSSLQHAASITPPPPHALLKRLTSFDIPNDITEDDFEKVLQEKLGRLSSIARAGKIREIVDELQELECYEISPLVQTLFHVVYRADSMVLWDNITTTFHTVLQCIQDYEMSNDPQKREDQRALFDMRVCVWSGLAAFLKSGRVS